MNQLFFAYADQRKDLPGVRREADYHYRLFSPGFHRDQFKIHSDRYATIASLSEYLTRFRDQIFLFHYSGHAGDSILELEEQEALSEGVAHLLAQCPHLQLVVLNGCCTAGQLSSLRKAGVKATLIGTHVPVADEEAYLFSTIFYQALEAGETAAQAFAQGIGTVKLRTEIKLYRGILLLEKQAASTPVWGIFPSERNDDVILPGSQDSMNSYLPAVGHFFGRDDDLQSIVSILITKPRAAIPITGAPGIGKSALCLSVLQAPAIIESFGQARYFLRCDGAANTVQLITELAKILGVPTGPELEDRVWQKLMGTKLLIVVDNAETPLGADRQAFEAFISRLHGSGEISILLTIRGLDLPYGIAWQKALKLEGLAIEAARQVFLATAGEAYREDPHLDLIIKDLDAHPLAMVLLAGQAIGEDHLQPLWERWNRQRTKLLQRGEATTPLTNLELSLELSLQGKRISQAGIQLFRILSHLPDGIHRDNLSLLAEDYGDLGATSLVRCGLASWRNQRIHMLNPIRSFGISYYPPDQDQLAKLLAFYWSLAKQGNQVGRVEGGDWVKRLTEELSNLESVILLGWKEEPEESIQAALGIGQFSLFTGLGSRSLLNKAYKTAKQISSLKLGGDCVSSLGDLAFRESNNEEARRLFEEAIPLYDQVGDLLGKANCYWSIGDLLIAENAPKEEAKTIWLSALGMFKHIGDSYSMKVMLRKIISITEGIEKAAFEDQLKAL